MNNIKFLINTILQIILFSFIPLIYWIIRGRKSYKFLEWIGLKKPNIKSKKYFIICLLISTTIAFSIFLIIPEINIEYTDNIAIGQFQFAGLGITGLLSALLFGIKTGLSEEILFRGFIAKRLINKFGFLTGNLIQSFVFGLIHWAMFITSIELFVSLIIFMLTAILAWIIGYINEKLSDGSIVPGILIHGLGNALVAIFALFNIL